MRFPNLTVIPALLAVLLFASPATADPPDVVGTFGLEGERSGAAYDARLGVAADPDGGLAVIRNATYADGEESSWTGRGRRLGNSFLMVRFHVTDTPGIVGSLDGNDGGGGGWLGGYVLGLYTFRGDRIRGRLYNRSGVGDWSHLVESGPDHRLADELDPFADEASPDDGRADDATPPAEEDDEPADGSITRAEVTRIVVQDGLDISDADPPHYEREEGAEEASRREEAAIFQDRPLRLAVDLAGEGSPGSFRLVGRDGDLELVGEAESDDLSAGVEVEVESTAPLNEAVAVNELEIAWSVEGPDETKDAGPATPLRVYTTYREPRQNVSRGRTDAASTLHFEMACTWANGATANVGEGSESIGYQCDNQMRHYVHPVDYPEGQTPAVPAYSPDSDPPTNYEDLPGSWRAERNGERGVSRLYYPPLEPDEDYEEYRHYARNFGWWVLDNPDHTGGRCNQQASLVAAILGTLGIEAEVHYLERTGRGRRTGRPVRQYFYSAGGGGPWNFHGLCKAVMEDGSEWLYDGSFSSPPRRKNGRREWAEGEGGPFIQEWDDWRYTDGFGGVVPEDDIPLEWDGVPDRSGDSGDE